MIAYFVLAIMNFTRIPLPYRWINLEQINFSKVMMFFPFTGAIVGTLSAIIAFPFHTLVPFDVLAILFLILPIILTGAFHEDGFADVCDSYGGYTKEKMLEIMKDSRIGAFGGIGIVFLILTKYVLFKEISVPIMPIALICAMLIARMCAMLPIKIFRYIGEGKTTPELLKFSWSTWLIALIITTSIGYFLIDAQIFIFLCTVQLITLIGGAYFRNKYGGMTGDIGGALEQIGEISVYFIFMLLSNGTVSF